MKKVLKTIVKVVGIGFVALIVIGLFAGDSDSSDTKSNNDESYFSEAAKESEEKHKKASDEATKKKKEESKENEKSSNASESDNDTEEAAAFSDNYIPSELEQITDSINAANKVEYKELFRDPNKYNYTNVCVTDMAWRRDNGQIYFINNDNTTYIYPRTIIDENGEPVSSILSKDVIMVVGAFKYGVFTDDYGDSVSTIEDAIVILQK